MVLLSLSSEKKNSENFKVYYNVPISLDKNYEITLIVFNIRFSWYNISNEFNGHA